MGSIPSNIGGFGVPIALNEQRQSQDISDRAALHMLQRKQLAEMYGNLAATPLPDRITDPNDPNFATSQAAYKAALDARAKGLEGAQKVYTPEHHASLFQHLHGLFAGTHKIDPVTGQVAPVGQGAPVTASSVASPTTPNGLAAVGSVAPSGSTSIPLVASVQPAPLPDATAPPAVPHPFATTSPDHPISKIQAGLNLLRDHLKAAAHPLPPEPGPDYQALAAAPTAAELKFARDKELQSQHWESNLDVANVRKDALIASLQARRPTPLGSVTTDHLLEQKKEDPDLLIYGPDGREMTTNQIAEIPPGMVWGKYQRGSYVFFSAYDPKNKQIHVGNEVIDVPPIGPVNNDNSTPLGVVNPGTASSHQVPGMNPGETVTLHNTNTPQTTGMVAPPASQPVTPPTPGTPTLLRRPTPAQFITQTYQQKPFPGLVAPGNIDVTQRPNIDNGDGTHSTTFSMGFNVDGKEVLVPGVGDGVTYPLRKLTTAEALDQYKKTGQNFGTFASPAASNAYAAQLHKDQARYGNTGQSNPGARAPGTAPVGGAVKTKPLASTAPSTSIGTEPPAFAKGTMLSQGRGAQNVISAMSVVGANIFGKGGDKPIWDNAWMYDKPPLRVALNKALTLNALKNPGTEENPTLMQTLATSIGVTGWSQEQVNQAAVEARQEVERLGGPEALAQFAREAAMQEDLPALRAATKASAAQGSLALAVRAAPVYNISSAQDFRNQLGTLLSTATSSMKGYPAINPEYVKWWERGSSAARGGPTSSNAPALHKFAIGTDGKRYPVLDPNAKLPLGWKWAD